MDMLKAEKPTEYLYKKGLYYFPQKTKVFVWGNDVIVDIPGRKPINITKYKKEKISDRDAKNASINLPVTDNGAKLFREYKQVSDYLCANPKLSLLTFDYATSHELALLVFFKSHDMIEAGKVMSEIKNSLPYLINIFRNPVMHLKDVDAVLTLEAVKRVNQSTVRHLSTHTENWDNVEKGAITPRRLLTRVYDDDYGIYENIVFRDLINEILSFLKRRINFLAEIIDTLNESVRLEDFSRLVHSSYYLAIGKLYTGFYKTENTLEINSMLKDTKSLYERIAIYKHRTVYAKNLNVKPVVGAIKKTNILSMHKDYKHVYTLYKKMKKSTIMPKGADAYLKHASDNYIEQLESQKSYGLFCEMLILFAAAGFNFKCATSDTVFENGSVCAKFAFKDWSLRIEDRHNAVLGFSTIDLIVKNKKAEIKYLLIPLAYYLGDQRKKQIERIVERLHSPKSGYDKYIFLDPFQYGKDSGYDYQIKLSIGSTDLFYAILPVSINEINSFRRIQKILFEAMMLSNMQDDTCGFCGGVLNLYENGKHSCSKCKTVVRNIKCVACGLDYKSAFVDTKIRMKVKKEERIGDLSEFFKQEKRHLFRSLNMKGNNAVCPYCGTAN